MVNGIILSLVGLSVILILTAASIPVFSDLAVRYNAKESAENIESDIKLIQSKAMAGVDGKDWNIYFTLSQNTKYFSYDKVFNLAGGTRISSIVLTDKDGKTETVPNNEGVFVLFKKIPSVGQGEIYKIDSSGSGLWSCGTNPQILDSCAGYSKNLPGTCSGGSAKYCEDFVKVSSNQVCLNYSDCLCSSGTLQRGSSHTTTPGTCSGGALIGDACSSAGCWKSNPNGGCDSECSYSTYTQTVGYTAGAACGGNGCTSSTVYAPQGSCSSGGSGDCYKFENSLDYYTSCSSSACSGGGHYETRWNCYDSRTGGVFFCTGNATPGFCWWYTTHGESCNTWCARQGSGVSALPCEDYYWVEDVPKYSYSLGGVKRTGYTSKVDCYWSIAGVVCSENSTQTNPQAYGKLYTCSCSSGVDTSKSYVKAEITITNTPGNRSQKVVIEKGRADIIDVRVE